MSEMKQELVMETTHGRKSKCKTEFKAVMNKVLVSGLILATLMGSTIIPVHASNISGKFVISDDIKITQTYGVSFDQTISNINNTIKAINDMKAKGQVSDAQIKELASQIYSLEKATMGITLSDKELSDIANVLNSAESAIDGLDNVQSVEIAIMLSRQFYGLSGGKDLVEEFNRENNFGTQNQNKYEVYSPAVDGTVRIPSASKNNATDSYTANNNFAAGSTSGQLTGTQLVNSFWDVKPTDWYYTQVQAMVQRGLFAGKGPIDNGVGTFAPNDTMTKAEFVTVVARMFYKDDEINNFSSSGSVWWDKYYNACVSKGIFSEYEMAYDSMEKGMSREEMSFVAIRALRKIEGQATRTYDMTKANSVIPDYSQVSKHLQSFVVQAYADGLLCGTDQAGTFAPKATLTRAEASTVLYRIVESDARTPNKELGRVISSGSSQSWADPIQINEGQKRENRPARAGDVFVKSNGERVMLKLGPNGILGEGQGVAPDIGLSMGVDICSANEKFSYDKTNYGIWKDSTGSDFNNGTYNVNRTTGEGHWYSEWMHLQKVYPKPTTAGTSAGEVSQDPYHLYQWDDVVEMWVNNF